MSLQPPLPSLHLLMPDVIQQPPKQPSRDEQNTKQFLNQSIEPGRPEPSQHENSRLHLNLGISERINLLPHHTTVGDTFSYRQSMDVDRFSLPSPISPRTTRCPSLTESLFSVCTNAPTDSPATSFDDKGGILPPQPRRDILHGHYHHHQNRVSKPYRSPARRQSFDHPTANRYNAPRLVADHKSEERLEKSEKRRRNHLESEKKRRENIKGGMDALFELVPKCLDINESKANILKLTKAYIVELKEELRHLSHENEQQQERLQRLSYENEELKRYSYGNSRVLCRL